MEGFYCYRKMVNNRRSSLLRKAAPIAIVLGAISIGVLSYTYLWNTPNVKQKRQSLGKKRIAFALNRRLFEQGVPISYLLQNFPDLVILLMPDLSRSDVKRSGQVPPGYDFRLVAGSSDIGVVHVIKHLRPELLVMPTEFDQNLLSGLVRFVGEMLQLDQSPEKSNRQMQDLIS